MTSKGDGGAAATHEPTGPVSFVGHESFPLRYGWLKKCVDAVAARPDVFAHDDAMVSLGVGKNMVKAIRHWGLITRVIEVDPEGAASRGRSLRVTPLGGAPALPPGALVVAQVDTLNNLDGVLLDADIEGDSIHVRRKIEIRRPKLSGEEADQCGVDDRKKITALNKMMYQKGGKGPPLGYYQDGAQMRGTFVEVAGPATASTASWVRPPLGQTGGRRTGSRQTRSRRTGAQHGGFPPSVMGAFASNGARLLPIAAYLGYKSWSKTKKAGAGTRTRSRSRARRQTRRSSRT